MACHLVPLRLLLSLVGGLALLASPVSQGLAESPVFEQTSRWEQDYARFATFASVQEPGFYYDESAAEPEAGPEHIRDNAFLVEEAFNQEAGEVQHIFNWIIAWSRLPGIDTRDFINTYTMEIPLGSQLHQFSFTTQFLTAFENPDVGPAVQQGDVGDTFLNYRYQLLSNDEFLWCARASR